MSSTKPQDMGDSNSHPPASAGIVFDFVDYDAPPAFTLDDLKKVSTESRMKYCGTLQLRYSIKDGKSYLQTWYCYEERAGCPRCRLAVGKRYRERVERAIAEGHELVKIELTKSEADKLRRNLKLQRDSYLRLPQEEYDLFIIDKDKATSAHAFEDVDPKQILEWEWHNLIAPPNGRNKSGTLGVAPPKEDQGISVNIETPIVKPNADAEMYARNRVEEETFDERPTGETDEEIVQSVKELIDRKYYLFEKYFKQAGGDVTFYVVTKENIDPRKIDWDREMQKIELEDCLAGTHAG